MAWGYFFATAIRRPYSQCLEEAVGADSAADIEHAALHCRIEGGAVVAVDDARCLQTRPASLPLPAAAVMEIVAAADTDSLSADLLHQEKSAHSRTFRDSIAPARDAHVCLLLCRRQSLQCCQLPLPHSALTVTRVPSAVWSV